MPGTLYIVATPIGNLDDVTHRALRVLKDVDVVAAEDTRHTKKLLNHYGIRAVLTSYHEHNERTRSRALAERLGRGETIALVSDAGTPTVSDPGYRLIGEAIRVGARVIPVPGPSALLALLSASGLATDRFVFEGFLPAQAGKRKKRLKEIQGESRTLVFFEAPHRLGETLLDLIEVFGDRSAALGRELTKLHEEIVRGRLSEIAAALRGREPRGECALAVAGAEPSAATPRTAILAEIRRLRAAGRGTKEIAVLLSERFSLPQREIYRMALETSG
jgi:16S rRNA (cytidine1402-2'-O)-methyltransferase